MLAALAAPDRFRVVRLLAGGPHNATEITRATGARAANVSRHLTALKNARLIRPGRRGRFMVYSLSPGF